MRLETAWHWAQRNPTLSALSLGELRARIQFDGTREFVRFLSKFATLRELYTDRRAIQQVAREAVADAAADNVRYLELRFSPDHFARHVGFDPHQLTALLLEAAQEQALLEGITVRFLCTIGRGYDLVTARHILDIALAFQEKGVVGVDLAGDELRHPLPPFESLLAQARAAGLGITVHAGEAGPPQSVWDAIQRFHAQRIGHGIRSIEDPRLLTTLQAQAIALEVCPTSNLQTGVVSHAAAHPLAALVAAGVSVALSSDDPSISGIRLADEYRFALEQAWPFPTGAMAPSAGRRTARFFARQRESRAAGNP